MNMNQILAGVTYLAVLGNVFFAAFLAATPADHALPWWVAAIVAGGNALVHALPSDGLPLPAKQVAKASAVICLLAWSLALSGCASLGLTGDPKNDLPVVSADILKTVNAACAEYAPVGALAVLVPDPKVQSIALTTNGVCDVATGQVIPGVASKLDASSAAWVGLSVGMLNALGVQPAAAAPVVPAAPAKGA
jgi:hypothetical protein